MKKFPRSDRSSVPRSDRRLSTRRAVDLDVVGRASMHLAVVFDVVDVKLCATISLPMRGRENARRRDVAWVMRRLVAGTCHFGKAGAREVMIGPEIYEKMALS